MSFIFECIGFGISVLGLLFVIYGATSLVSSTANKLDKIEIDLNNLIKELESKKDIK
jgi:hypothetical protein